MQRLLYAQAGFLVMAREDSQPAVQGVFTCLSSESRRVAFAAALTVRAMLVQLSAAHARGERDGHHGGGEAGALQRFESANRRAVLRESRIQELVACILSLIHI